MGLLAEFPFIKPEGGKQYSKAVAAAFILTALVRRILPTAPGFVFSAPQAGTGKSYLVECGCMLAFGYESIDPIPFSDDVDEQRKTFASFAIEGPEIIFFDNAEGIIGGEVLCMWMTSTTFKARGLGKNETIYGPTNSLMVFTGNHATIKADATRRFLLCEMDAEVDCPELREFKNPDLFGYIRDNRPSLVAAGLTWLLGYLVAEDKPQLSPFGSFEQWSNLVRGAVLWAGLDDPLGSREAIQAKDPAREELTEILRLWWKTFNEFRPNEFKKVSEALEEPAIADFFRNLGLTDKKGDVSSKSVGRWISDRMGKVINIVMNPDDEPPIPPRIEPLRIELKNVKTGGVKQYRVTAVKPQS